MAKNIFIMVFIKLLFKADYNNLFWKVAFYFMSINDVVKEFIFELQVQNYSVRAIKGYKNNISKFINYCKTEYEIFELEETNYI